MKYKRLLWNWLACLATIIACVACGKDDGTEGTPPSPQQEEIKQEINFSIPSDNNGAGTASNPYVAPCGDTLSVVITQKSSYNDPNGVAYSCEPTAVIKLFSEADTLHLENIQNLLNVIKNTGQQSQSLSGDKKTLQQQQTFLVGGKDVIFELSYDVFTYVNSLNKSIEMPYVKVNPAKYGSEETDEKETQTVISTVKGIRLRPIEPETRAGTITNYTTYEVSVLFTVDIESVNVKDAMTQSLSFESRFFAIVESSSEIPDPKTEFFYELSHKSGTTSIISPYEVIAEDTLSLEWQGNASYRYFSIEERTEKEIKCWPKAFSKVFAPKDTLWIEDISQFQATVDSVVTTSGTNPVEVAKSYAFTIADKRISVNYGYQLYQPIKIEDAEVVFPSLAIGSPEIRLEFTEKTTTKMAKVYNVTLTIDQELTAVNTSEPQSERVQYVIKYIAAIPIEAAKIVDIRYRKPSPAGPGWNEAHDNIPLVYRYELSVDTVFSDGSVHTAEIYGMPHPIFWALNDLTAIGSEYGEVKQDINGETVYFFANQDELVDEAYHNVTISRIIAVPDTAKITLKDYGEGGPDPADLTRYSGYDPEHPQPGWYMTNLAPYHNARIYYDGRWLMFFDINFIWYNDIYYAKDIINGGRIISFLGDENDVDDVSYEPDINFDITTGTTVLPDGKQAKSFVHTCTGRMLGWDQPFVFKIKLYFITYDAENPPF